MTAYEVPLSAQPQKLQISLGGVVYGLTVTWNDPGQCWVAALYDSEGNQLASPLPLVTGADILEQYGYLGVGGRLFAQVDGDLSAVPDFAGLGTTGHLYFVTSL